MIPLQKTVISDCNLESKPYEVACVIGQIATVVGIIKCLGAVLLAVFNAPLIFTAILCSSGVFHFLAGSFIVDQVEEIRCRDLYAYRH